LTLAPEQPRAEQDVPFVGCPRRRGGPPPAPAADRPRLADGVQLLGEYAGTGYVEPQHLARRPNGQLVQLSQLLHLVAEECDGSRDHAQIAERVSQSYGKTVSADNVATLVDKLRPLGVLAGRDGSNPDVQKSDPLLGLKLRTQLLPPSVVRVVAKLAQPLFWPPVVVAVVAALVAVDVWLFFVHGLGQGLRATVQQPAVFLLVFGVIIVATAFHELGHAAACSYGGAKPGGMGAGVYIVWPAFYTDVTDAYRLSRGGRLRTDLGGVYFNGIAVLVVAGCYALTGYDPLILICFLLQMLVLQQMLPLLRLDGYYVLSDLVGVPDLFRRIGPVLRDALPFRRREPEVEQLKPWVRKVVTGWVLVLVPALLLNVLYLVLAAPRLVSTGWDSGMRLLGSFSAAEGVAAQSWIVVQLALLALPFLGMTYTMARVVHSSGRGAWRWSAGSPPRRLGVVTGGALLVGLLGLAWWPDGRYQPYREGERGTITQHVGELRAAGQGSPLLRSPAQAQEELPPVREGSSAVLEADSTSDADAPGTGEDTTGTTTDEGSPGGGTTGEGTTGGGTTDEDTSGGDTELTEGNTSESPTSASRRSSSPTSSTPSTSSTPTSSSPPSSDTTSTTPTPTG
jgi:putative peptide zinc metalloprotease protein